jgi:hypothetical protein
VERRSGPVICVGSSSKKAGKSRLAALLVERLGARCAIKSSSGKEHAPAGEITSEPLVLRQPGTDTGKLLEAGAEFVLWVHPAPGEYEGTLARSIRMLPDDCILVIEGNSAVPFAGADFVVFLMVAPFDDFKPGALQALRLADLVVIELPASGARDALETELTARAPSARLLFYNGDEERDGAFGVAVEEARASVSSKS